MTCFSDLGQQNRSAMALKVVLQNITQQHQIQFNYLDETIADLKIIPPKNSKSVQYKIKYLTKKTGLAFNFVNAKTISVVNSKSLEKLLEKPVLAAMESLNEVTIQNILTTGISRKTDGSFLINGLRVSSFLSLHRLSCYGEGGG
jgi:hypothetical protein